ncbi:hypothetical protein SUNI508_13002 [Seiridium unicorne]|uniref:Uncharacterized protein n=1 Tax=Seiridium unicorne TaxID=138068 RepID=A0ABR2VEX4_9PEZI
MTIEWFSVTFGTDTTDDRNSTGLNLIVRPPTPQKEAVQSIALRTGANQTGSLLNTSMEELVLRQYDGALEP